MQKFIFLLLFVCTSLLSQSVNIISNSYLEGQSNHENIEIEFEKTSDGFRGLFYSSIIIGSRSYAQAFSIYNLVPYSININKVDVLNQNGIVIATSSDKDLLSGGILDHGESISLSLQPAFPPYLSDVENYKIVWYFDYEGYAFNVYVKYGGEIDVSNMQVSLNYKKDEIYFDPSINQAFKEILPNDTQNLKTQISSTKTYTDVNGEYSAYLFKGLYNIKFRKNGYLQHAIEDEIIYSSKTIAAVTLNIDDPPIILTNNINDAIEDVYYQYQLEVSNPDSLYLDSLSFTLIDSPGWMTINNVGILQGTPTNDDVNESVSIVVGVSDIALNSDTAYYTMSVQKVNDPPIIDLPDTLKINEDETKSFLLENYILDVDDSLKNLIVEINELSGENLDYFVTPDNDSLRLSGGENINGEFYLEVSVTDPLSAVGIDTALVLIAGINDPPVWSSNPSFSLNEDSFKNISFSTLSQFVSDVDNDPIEFSFSIYECPNFETSFDNRSIIIQPKGNWFGTDTALISVTDKIDTVFTEVLLSALPINDPPQVTNLDSIIILEDSSIVISLDNHIIDIDSDHGSIEWNFTLLENQEKYFIGYSIVKRELTITPKENVDVDETLFKIWAVDDSLDADTVISRIIIIPLNDPPYITFFNNIVFNEDDTLFFQVDSTLTNYGDYDNDDLTLNFTSSTNIKIDKTDSFYMAIPTPNWFGVDTLKFIISDGIENTSADVVVEVLPINDEPFFANLPSEIILDVSHYTDSLFLFEFVEDIETPDTLLNYTFETDNDSLKVYMKENGWVIISTEDNFYGSSILTIILEDESLGWTQDSIIIKKIRTTDVELNLLPHKFRLYQNYPNPFNPSTSIKYGLPEICDVSISVFSIDGQELFSRSFQSVAAGYHSINLNAASYSSGVYLYVLEAIGMNSEKSFRDVKKMLLLK